MLFLVISRVDGSSLVFVIFDAPGKKNLVVPLACF